MDDIVRKLIRRHGTNCPYKIAKQLRIDIWYSDLGESTRGFYFRKLKRRYIGIHDGLDDMWARFVCAHELGHDQLHPGISRFFLDEHTLFNAGKFERQANHFALRLLTAFDSPEDGESLEAMLKRNGIPLEMQKYF